MTGQGRTGQDRAGQVDKDNARDMAGQDIIEQAIARHARTGDSIEQDTPEQH